MSTLALHLSLESECSCSVPLILQETAFYTLVPLVGCTRKEPYGSAASDGAAEKTQNDCTFRYNWLVECSKKTVGLSGVEAQDSHVDFHTALKIELMLCVPIIS